MPDLRHEILAGASSLVFHADDVGALAPVAARLLVPLAADWVSLELHAEGERALNVAHRDAAAEPLLRRVRQGAVLDEHDPFVLATVRSTLSDVPLDDADERYPGLALRALLVVPLRPAGRPSFGALLCGFETSAPTDGQRAVIAEVAARVAAALALARDVQNARAQHAPSLQSLAMIAHDLRNPLSTIATSSALLARVLPPEVVAAVALPLRAIDNAIRRAAGQVDDLLDATVVESGRFSVIRVPASAADLLGEVADEKSADAGAIGVTLRIDAEAALPAVSIDPARIRQALLNLVGNALKFTPRGGQVTLRARRAHSVVFLGVRDTGSGIAPEDLARIGRPFWHRPQAGRQGYGLGLYIAKSIAEAHGGRLLISSGESGTTVELAVPIAGLAAKPPRETGS